MKVWIDQSLCVGNGVCVDMAPEVFMIDGGLAYVIEQGKVLPKGQAGLGEVPEHLLDGVIDAAEECPAECIYLEV